MQEKLTEEEIAIKKRKKTIYYRIFGIVAGCMLIFFFLYRIETVSNTIGWFVGILSPVFWGLAMAYLLNPVLLFFEKHISRLLVNKKHPDKKHEKLVKTLSITLTVLFGIVLLTSLILMIIPEFLKSLQKLTEIIPTQLTNFLNWLDTQASSENEITRNFSSILQSVVDYFNKWLNTDFSSRISSILSIATDGIIYVINFIMDFFIAIVVTVYTLIEKKRFIGQSKKLIYAVFTPERANDILLTARHGHKIFGKYLSGKIIDSILVGIVCFILMSILGIPYALLVSVIVGFTNIIPFFGPFIGGAPSAIIILLEDSNKGLIFIFMIFILQQIEGSILEPRILGMKTGISEFWVTFALLLFGGLFGFVGMVVAVPLFAVIYYMAKTLINRKLDQKSLPISSAEYFLVDSLEEDGFQYHTEKQNEVEKDKGSHWYTKFLKKPKNFDDTKPKK